VSTRLGPAAGARKGSSHLERAVPLEDTEKPDSARSGKDSWDVEL